MIPSVAHFIWYGPHFWWVNALAIRSAAARGGFERVVLHHDHDLSGTPAFEELRRLETFEARRLAPRALFERLGALGGPLTELHDQLKKPNARANMVRAAILATEGGVYLDTDTITVKSLDALRSAPAFCGRERVVFPVELLRDKRVSRILKSWSLMAVREACRQMPQGWRWFRRIESWYPTAVNNAVVGSIPGHPLMLQLVQAMVDLPAARRHVPYALGTHLLQDRVALYDGRDLVVHPPSVFFPLGPEISHHWFRFRAGPQPAEILADDTHVVHWYASVRTKNIAPHIDEAYVRAHASRQLFSALALPVINGSPQ
ncbi:MAG: glycosyltransferase [Myxococcota bacterium]